MDLAVRQAIERGEAAWALAVTLPPSARLGPVRDALARLVTRTIPEARVAATSDGLIVWTRGEGEPAAAGRLAARLAALLPERPDLVRHLRLPGDAEALAARALAPEAWPGAEAVGCLDPGAEALVALARLVAARPPEGWVKRAPVVALKPGAPARVVARLLSPDAAVLARALQAAGKPLEAMSLGPEALRVLEPTLLAALPRLVAAEAGEVRLVLPLPPEAVLGGGYDRLEQAVGPAGMARIVPTIALADALAAPRAFASARARIAADGQRLLLAAPGAEAIGLLRGLAAEGDLLSLPATAAHEAAGAVASLGPERVVLVGCRTEAEIAHGVGLGIGLFEGPVVEARLGRSAAAGR